MLREETYWHSSAQAQGRCPGAGALHHVRAPRSHVSRPQGQRPSRPDSRSPPGWAQRRRFLVPWPSPPCGLLSPSVSHLRIPRNLRSQVVHTPRFVRGGPNEPLHLSAPLCCQKCSVGTTHFVSENAAPRVLPGSGALTKGGSRMQEPLTPETRSGPGFSEKHLLPTGQRVALD